MGFFTPVTEQPIPSWYPSSASVSATAFAPLGMSPNLVIPAYSPAEPDVVPEVVPSDSPNPDTGSDGGGKWNDYDPYEMDGLLDKNGPYHPYDTAFWGGNTRPSQFDQDSFFGKVKDTVGFMRPGLEAMVAFNKLGGMLASPMGPIGLLGMALGATPTSMLNSWNEPVMQAQLQQTWNSMTPEMQAQFGSLKGYNAAGIGMFGTGNSMKPGTNAMTQKAMDLIGVTGVNPVDFAMRNRVDAIAATRGWNMAGLAEVGKASTAMSYSAMKDFNAIASQFDLKSVDYVANAHISDMTSYTGNPKMKETAALMTALGYEDQLSDMVNKDGSLTGFGKKMSDIADSLKDNMNKSIHTQNTKAAMNNPTATPEEVQKAFKGFYDANVGITKIPDYIGAAIHRQFGVTPPSVTDTVAATTSNAVTSPSLTDAMNANASKFGWGGLANAISQVDPSFGSSWEGLMGGYDGNDSSSGGYDSSGDRSGLNDKSSGGEGSKDSKAEASRDSSRADGPNGGKAEGRNSGMS